jgi:hypothetical protein
MAKDGTLGILRQEKELLRLPRNHMNTRAPRRSTRLRRCSAVARQLWPLVFALVGVTSAAAGLLLVVSLNLSRSAARGIWTAADPPARGALVVTRLPAAAVFRRATRVTAGPCACPARRGAGPRSDRRHRRRRGGARADRGRGERDPAPEQPHGRGRFPPRAPQVRQLLVANSLLGRVGPVHQSTEGSQVSPAATPDDRGTRGRHVHPIEGRVDRHASKPMFQRAGRLD